VLSVGPTDGTGGASVGSADGAGAAVRAVGGRSDAHALSIHVALALALGGATRLEVRHTRAALAEHPEMASAWAAVGCALGVAISVVPQPSGAEDPIGTQRKMSHVLVLGADGVSEPAAGWPAVEAHAMAGVASSWGCARWRWRR
jgi:hypothetical protein